MTLPISHIVWDGRTLPVKFIGTTQVKEGVQCDIYSFIGDSTKDLGIIRIQPHCRTPLQKVLKGDKTIEGYISGKGLLQITDLKGNIKEYKMKKGSNFSLAVELGQLMQWQASDSELTVFEICLPPYEDGRFENIE